MRVMPRIFAAAILLTAGMGAAGLTAAETAAPALAASSCSAGDGISGSFQILNEQSGYYAIKPSGSGGVSSTDTFFNDVNSVDPTYFCSEDSTSHSGVTYYYYNDNANKCLTVNASASPQYTYEASCGKYPASQEWHWYYNGTDHDGTLKNYDTGDCLWFTGFNASTGRESPINPINVGGCTRNENNTIIQSG
ncbi:MAG TPA: RICIN domain-containing protein [Streptosporangiaceae bacterium]|nr:RICIN domain-containing protein [Streptosporangiaceae bacterium]